MPSGGASAIQPDRRLIVLATLLIAAPLAVTLLPPLPQDPAYHQFADRRGLLGIPNFLNIASNLAFLAVGLAGVLLCAPARRQLGARRAWLTCFAGVALVAFGSGYYHVAPDNGTLACDRLPMSIGFMALSVGVLADYVNPRLERRLLAPAVALGLASVIYWHFADDLRLYVLVQFLPLLMLPAVLWLYPRARAERAWLFTALAVYLVAKLTELFDREVYLLTGEFVSGHTLKHLLAATALFTVYGMLRRRVRRAEQER